MAKDLGTLTQYELTTDLAINLHKLDLKDCAIKLLLHLSAFYPNILQTRKSLLIKFPKASLDRAIKELSEKGIILMSKDKISLNLSLIYHQIEDKKVINLMPPCNNKQHVNKKTEQTAKQNKQIDGEILKTLKDWHIFNAADLLSNHSEEVLRAYISYAKVNGQNPAALFLHLVKNNVSIESLKNKNSVTQTENAADNSKTDYIKKYYGQLESKDFAIAALSNFYYGIKPENLKNDTIVMVLLLKSRWNLSSDDFKIIETLENEAKTNKYFAQKYQQINETVCKQLAESEFALKKAV